MTKSGGAAGEGETTRCRLCRRRLPERVGAGRPRVYCSGRCRQADWVAGRRAAELELSEHELIIARRSLDRLYDDLDVLGRALVDTERDLERPDVGTDPVEMRRILDWLLEAARTAAGSRIDPA